MDNMPRFDFDKVAQQWVDVNKKEYHFPKLVNPDYVDCEPNELWINLITGEVKETPNLQTSLPTRLETG